MTHDIDTSVPSIACMYDPAAARANREFLGRAVGYLAGECGIRQFLDIGSGLPAGENVHEAAQRIAPESRVVYVDNDRFKSGCTHVCEVGRAAWSGALRALDTRSQSAYPR